MCYGKEFLEDKILKKKEKMQHFAHPSQKTMKHEQNSRTRTPREHAT